MKTKIIGIMSKKGGSGKTTIAFNLAEFFGQKKSVLAIDADEITTALFEYSNPEEGNLSFLCEKRGKTIFRNIKKRDKSEFDNYDYVVIDVNPNNEEIQKEVISIADAIIIPIAPTDGADYTQGVKQIRLCIEGKKLLNKDLSIMVFINKFRSNTANSQILRTELEQLKKYDIEVLSSTVGDRIIFQSPRQGTAFHLGKNSKGAQEVSRLASEITRKLNKKGRE